MHRGQYFSSKVFVMGATVVLGPVICQVGGARSPMKTKLFLCHSASKPVEPHIHWLGPFWLDLVVDYPIGC